MMEIIFLIVGISFFVYIYFQTDRNSKFDLYDNDVYFHSKKISLRYSEIISIERDISSREGKTTYFAYIITYYDEHEKIDSFRFYKAMTDAAKWNRLKSNVVDANPLVKINESIL